MPSYNWLELEIERIGNEVAVKGRGCRHEHPEQHTLGPDLSGDLDAFAERVRAAARSGKPLGPDLERAQALHRALLQGELKVVLARLLEDAKGKPVLLQLMLEKDLQAFPWEALCEPGTDQGFLGNSDTLLPVRGVHSSEPMPRRDVSGAVRVLAIAPLHENALSRLKGALHESLASGEVEWLEPLSGDRARKSALLTRLSYSPSPHIIHFIGHGGFQDGQPVLRLADKDDEESWIQVELLAQQLRRCRELRLVVLEACEGASPGNQACAAELLARKGVDSVVAHLWPVRTDVARECSGAFYRALTCAGDHPGDVANSLNEARRSVLAERESAEAFSPVLYLRGEDPVLFNFRRQTGTLPPPPPARTGAAAPSRALQQLLAQPFTLVLGDRWEEGKYPVLHGLRERLREELARKTGGKPPKLPLSTLAEHILLHAGEDELDTGFQEAFDRARVKFTPPLAGALARCLGPGVHVTLLRLPVLEQSLARHHPKLTIDVLEPPLKVGGPITTFRRKAGDGDRWERLAESSAMLDTEQEVVVLRLCSSFFPTAEIFKNPPLLAGEDWLRGMFVRRPDKLIALFRSVLSQRPALFLGLSVLNFNHRMLIDQIYGTRELKPDSVAVLAPGDYERKLWEQGSRLPGYPHAPSGIQVVEAGDEDFLAQLEALAAPL